MTSENTVYEMIATVKDIESMKSSYIEAQKEKLSEIETLIMTSAQENGDIISAVKEYGNMIYEEAFLSGFKAGITLINALESL